MTQVQRVTGGTVQVGCAICAHADRAEIERVRRRGVPDTWIAEAFLGAGELAGMSVWQAQRLVRSHFHDRH